jgi:hypothetical protein
VERLRPKYGAVEDGEALGGFYRAEEGWEAVR